MWVCAEMAGAQPLIANREAIGPWESFYLVQNSDGTHSLKSRTNNLFVCADNSGSSYLIANRTNVGPWESFELIGYTKKSTTVEF